MGRRDAHRPGSLLEGHGDGHERGRQNRRGVGEALAVADARRAKSYRAPVGAGSHATAACERRGSAPPSTRPVSRSTSAAAA